LWICNVLLTEHRFSHVSNSYKIIWIDYLMSFLIWLMLHTSLPHWILPFFFSGSIAQAQGAPGLPVYKDTPEWGIPQQTKLKYAQLFNSLDRNNTGFLTGIQARGVLVQSQLPQVTLAKIWWVLSIYCFVELILPCTILSFVYIEDTCFLLVVIGLPWYVLIVFKATLSFRNIKKWRRKNRRHLVAFYIWRILLHRKV